MNDFLFGALGMAGSSLAAAFGQHRDDPARRQQQAFNRARQDQFDALRGGGIQEMQRRRMAQQGLQGSGMALQAEQSNFVQLVRLMTDVPSLAPDLTSQLIDYSDLPNKEILKLKIARAEEECKSGTKVKVYKYKTLKFPMKLKINGEAIDLKPSFTTTDEELAASIEEHPYYNKTFRRLTGISPTITTSKTAVNIEWTKPTNHVVLTGMSPAPSTFIYSEPIDDLYYSYKGYEIKLVKDQFYIYYGRKVVSHFCTVYTGFLSSYTHFHWLRTLLSALRLIKVDKSIMEFEIDWIRAKKDENEKRDADLNNH